MISWKQYPSQNVELSRISKYIVKELGYCLKKFFSPDTTGGQRTALIKCALCQLGHKRQKGKRRFKVYTNRLPPSCQNVIAGKCKNREWLYDLHWYTEKNGYQPTSLPLVVECEWSLKRKEDKYNDPCSAIKYDFQKLLVANAELRLMIFKITRGKKHKKNSDLDKYFDKTIESYGNLEENSIFLFIAFDERAKTFHYVEKLKGQKRTNRYTDHDRR
jgi:hypothetical protein